MSDNLQHLAQELANAFSAQDYQKCATLLTPIKIALAAHNLLVPTPSHSPPPQDLVVARDILEAGALSSINLHDDISFSRYIALLRPYYYDANTISQIPPSANKNKLLSLWLLLLLSNNQIVDFHTELETLENVENDVYLSYPVRLERWLMEGSYDRVYRALTHKSQVPSPEFSLFSDTLIETIRGEIAKCFENSYASIPITNARVLLFLQSDKQTVDFVKTQQPDWIIKDGRIYFPAEKPVEDDEQIDPQSGLTSAEQLIGHTLGYAKEMESIV